jgi:hypothetical protein
MIRFFALILAACVVCAGLILIELGSISNHRPSSGVRLPPAEMEPAAPEIRKLAEALFSRKQRSPETVYLSAYKDKDGDWLDGAGSYRLRVPPNAPAAQFWSLTVYAVNTRSLVQNKEQISDQSSRMDLVKNADGSVDVYVGSSGWKCAVCGMRIVQLLDAAHIRGVAEGGSDDPRNGLMLCVNHHRAFAPDSHRARYLASCLNGRLRSLEISRQAGSKTDRAAAGTYSRLGHRDSRYACA